MNRRPLPVLNGRVAESSLYTDGTRKRIEPAPVKGRFARARKIVFALLVAVWVLLPVIQVNGRPALFLDVEHRRFFVFGGTFTAQDFWLVFFLATGVGFGLVFTTAVLGRVFCGWLCPQTVFMEVFFRPIERITKNKLARHAVQVFSALVVAHVFIAYFVSIPALWRMMLGSPAAHPEAFAWMLALTATFYLHFAFFREQLCVVVCPYGRLQSVLLDDESLVIKYDEARGEPRGKRGTTKGDCVDCKRCIAVCPTGIDIRNGLQMDCVACTACIDACDDVMDKLGRPRGLIRYSMGKVVRLRVVLYAALLAIGAAVFFFATRSHATFEATLLRQPGATFVRDEHGVRNDFVVHVVNKSASAKEVVLEPASEPPASFVLPFERFELEPLSERRVPLVVTAPADVKGRPKIRLVVRVGEESRVVEAVFLGGAP